MTALRHRFAWAVLLAALSSHSFAQFGGGGGGMGGMGGGRRGRTADAPATSRPSDSAGGPAAQANKIRDALYDLRVRLMITPEQGPLWDSFDRKVWDLVVKGSLGRAPAPPADDLTAAQAVQQRAAEAREKAVKLQDLADALTRLYDALSPEQRHVADQSLPALLP